MIDVHIHTEYSSDSSEPMENYIKKAISLGKSNIIGFTEHFDFDYAYENVLATYVDFVGFFQEIAEMKKKYEGQIKILVGAEFGYSSNRNSMALSNMIYDKYNLDYAINSIHLSRGEDLWFDEYFQNKTKKQAFEQYLNSVLESLETETQYHIVAHLGYCQRKAPYQDKIMRYEEFSDLLDAIFKKMISKGKILEINTSTRGVCDLIPSREMLERYYQLGGRLITFSSDAHALGRLFDRYEYVCEVAKSIGFENFAYVENGKICFENI